MNWKALGNSIVGAAASAGTWTIGAMEHIETAFRVLGVVAGSLAACVSLAVAIRSWRRGK